MTYSELSSAIKGFAENEFPLTAGNFTSTNQINTFIQQAEQRIYNSVQFPSLRKNVTGATSNGNQYLSTPNDFLSVFSLSVTDPVTGEYTYLLNKDVAFIREAFPFPSATGKPTHYAIFGPTTTAGPPPVITNELTLILGPTPNNAYSMELHYYYIPESIVTAGTTWLGDNFDSVLLYGSLLEAAAFMKSSTDTIKNYTDRYNEALTLAKRLGDGLQKQDSYRSGSPRYPVQ